MSRPDEDAPEVLPPLVSQILATLWIVLLGGRWLATPWMIVNDPKGDLDRPLFYCYLALLIVTLAVLALRVVRRAGAPRSRALTPEPVQPTHADTSKTPGKRTGRSTSARSSEPCD